MVMLQAFNGAGDTLTPTIVNIFGFWILEIPLAYFLAIPARMHSNGVFISIVVAECAMAIAGIILFRQGRWKLQKISPQRNPSSGHSTAAPQAPSRQTNRPAQKL